MLNDSTLLNRFVPITNFNRGQSSRIFERLQSENQLIVLKNNQATAVILSPSEFTRLSEIEENYNLLLETIKRLENSSNKTIGMDELLKELGINKKDINSIDDAEIE